MLPMNTSQYRYEAYDISYKLAVTIIHIIIIVVLNDDEYFCCQLELIASLSQSGGVLSPGMEEESMLLLCSKYIALVNCK